MKFIANSRTMRALVREARRYAGFDASVLVTGETGVGKDALAQLIHRSGPRRRLPFVTIDCPGLPASLVEAELFGHERGAFTDATMARPGRFEQAGAGTIYLDAVGSLSLDAQGALLRVVEEKQVTRLGATTILRVPARVIASADAGLEAAVQRGSFRTDLYHRLRVLPLLVPPLRERRDDILPLATAFAADIAVRMRRNEPSFAPDAEDVLLRYAWPGNARELRYCLERALIAGAGDRLTADDLPSDVLEGGEAYLAPAGETRPTLEDVERRYIALTLQHVKGNQTEAAKILGISRKALWEKRKRYGME